MKLLPRLALFLLSALTVLCIVLYVPACLASVVAPHTWVPLGIFSIVFFYVWFVLILFLVVWYFTNKRIALVLLLLVALGLPIVKNVVAVNRPSTFVQVKKPGVVRIMQWNCNGLEGSQRATAAEAERAKAVAFIKKYDPDIICIQDFSETVSLAFHSNTSLLRDSLGFKYYTYNPHFHSNEPWGNSSIGIAIFSKYPVRDSGRLLFPVKNHPETILWSDFLINNKQMRVVTTHLQSMHLTRQTKLPLGTELWQDSLVINHGSKFDKLRYFQPYHAVQANFLRSFLDTCSMPLIITADLNSVPSSYVYNKVKGQLSDAFIQKNFGLGRSYHSIQPALRIDYIFYNRAINNEQTSLFHTTFSDHDPVLMDFSIQ